MNDLTRIRPDLPRPERNRFRPLVAGACSALLLAFGSTVQWGMGGGASAPLFAQAPGLTQAPGAVSVGDVSVGDVAPTGVSPGKIAGVPVAGDPLAPVRTVAGTVADVLFRNARILDGSGNPWVLGDVAVRGDRIVGVGRLAGWSAAVTVDVGGLYLAPGFIDVHSHAAEGLADPERSHAFPHLAQGITTVFINPDGQGPTDLEVQQERLLRDGLGVNVAQLIGHGAVRGGVVGAADRAATADELGAMEALVRRGMELGAFGLSSGTFYAPGSFAGADEIHRLAGVAAEFGGVYTSHIRDESDYSIGLVAAVEEVIEVARASGIRAIVTHVKALGPRVWGASATVIEQIEAARAEGLELFADQYAYTASATSLGAALLPRWAEEGGAARMRERLRDPEILPRILPEIEENLDRRGGANRIQFRSHGADPSVEGRTLDAVAEVRGLGVLETVVALMLEGNPGIVSFNMDEADLVAFMRQPWTMASSDGEFPAWGAGVPHPRAYGAFARRLREYVVETPALSLEEAIRGMTSLPALVHRMDGRGRIEVGMVADLVVFDLDQVRDRATFTEPHQLSEGMVHVLVNGTFAIRDGAFTDVRSGRVLRLGMPDRER
jgi:N-acyl-D-amino-acid deacylase